MTQKLPMLSEVVDAYRQLGQRLLERRPLDPRDVSMLVRLSMSKEAARAFPDLALSAGKGLIFIDDCVTTHRLYTGEHKAQVERIGSAPNYKKMLAKLESLVKDFGALTKDEEKAFRTIRFGLSDRQRYHEDDLWSKSQKGDDDAARSRAIGWLKESVSYLSRRPNYEPLMTLCEVVLNTAPGDISLDSVKRAVTPRAWLRRRFSKRGADSRRKKELNPPSLFCRLRRNFTERFAP